LYVPRYDPSFCAANATVTLSALSSGGHTSFGIDRAVSSSSASQLRHFGEKFPEMVDDPIRIDGLPEFLSLATTSSSNRDDTDPR
jgi:hypothetical protein